MKITRFKTENIDEKLYLLELMKTIANCIDSEEHSLLTTYKITGQEQAVKWDAESGSCIPLWEDEEKTVPKMSNKWEEVPKKEDEYSPSDLMKLKVIEELRKALANAC